MYWKTYLLLPVLIVLFSCSKRDAKNYYEIQGFTQGTTYTIIYSESQENDYSAPIDSILSRIDESLSIYNPNSTISKINRNESRLADSLLIENIVISKEIWEQTDGCFDITVGPIVNALGFGAKSQSQVDSAEIHKLLPLVGMDKLRLEGNEVIKELPEMFIDVNAIAQGYTVDQIGHYLESKKVTDYMVEVGGEVLAKGVNNRSTKWVIGLDKPVDNALPGDQIQIKIQLSDKGLATSGNYRKFYIHNGVKYSHTIDPKRGFSAHNNLLSATVVAKNATYADCYATALMVMGLDKSKEFLLKHPELNAYLIYSGPKGEYLVWMTDGLKEMIQQ